MTTNPEYRGRFAPSPTGLLHFGSLVAAVGSYLDAKHHQGRWLVRIEDIDLPRAIPKIADVILFTLERFGMEWDEIVLYQSQRNPYYQAAIEQLAQQGLVYPCACSRKEIADSSIIGINGPIYQGTCLEYPPAGNSAHALRIRTHDEPVAFCDRLMGQCSQQLKSQIGDFVLRRADGIYAYQLAVVVDDAAQHISHVVRGADLLDSTPRQIFLQQLLGVETPHYMHLPVVINAQGQKLSKQTLATPLDPHDVLVQLSDAVRFLGQNPPKEITQGNVDAFWQWATQNWRSEQIPVHASQMW